MRPQRWSTPPDRVVVALALVAIAAGAFFRIHHLARPLFWQDETATALRATGHHASDYLTLFDGRVHALAEVVAFESVDPAKGPADVVDALAREDPQHPPLFYLLERAWMGAFGASASAMRALSVVFGIAGLGLALLAGRAVADDARAGWVAAALLALSPYFVLASRQAREYALLVDAILLTTYTLVVALRRGGAGRWAVYAVTAVVAGYVNPLIGLVAVGHGATTLLLPGPRLRRALAWLGAWALAALAYAPWALRTASVRGHVAAELDWVKTTYPPLVLAEKWAFNLGALAFDGEFASLRLSALALVAITLLALAIAVGLRSEDRLARIVPLLVALPTLLALVGLDVVERAHFATVPRFMLAVWTGLELAAAVGIARALGSASLRMRRAALAGWVTLLVLGTAAGTIRDGAENWWDNGDPLAFQALARTIDAAPAPPLVVSEERWNVPLELGRYLRPDARLLLFSTPVPELAPNATAYVVAPSSAVLATLRASANARATNVSPAVRTALTDVHAALHAPAADAPVTFETANVASNALWLLAPRAP